MLSRAPLLLACLLVMINYYLKLRSLLRRSDEDADNWVRGKFFELLLANHFLSHPTLGEGFSARFQAEGHGPPTEEPEAPPPPPPPASPHLELEPEPGSETPPVEGSAFNTDLGDRASELRRRSR